MTDFSQYVKFTESGVAIRSNRMDSWLDIPVFNLREAEELADYLKSKIDEHRRHSPEVQRLASILESASEVDYTFEDMAVELVEKGYHTHEDL